MRCAHAVAEVRAAEDELLAVTPEGALMTRAATGLAHAIADFLGAVYGARVLLAVGAGNNGGDALFAGARLAARGAQVDAVLLTPDKVHAAGLRALRLAGGAVRTTPRGPYDVAVDGIVGIGGSGPLRDDARAVVDAVGDDVPWVAVDVPSGVEVDTGEVSGPHVRAALTVTFGTHKNALLVDPAAQACGVVHLVDLGLDLPEPGVESLQADDVARLLPSPEIDAHKYIRGVVGVRAGSSQYPGAGLLCVHGAASGLAGMVRYVASEPEEGEARAPVEALVNAMHPEVVLGEGRVQAWVVGSGTGSSAAGQLHAALSDDVPVVVDADALAVLDEGAVRGRPAILTPHAGELARMFDLPREVVEAEQLTRAREAAARHGCVVMLKSRHTLVAEPGGRVRVTTVGPPWLATAGAGDVLAGLVGALLAAGLPAFDAASVGSWVHGAAAAMVRPSGPLVAGEVARAVPEVCARLLRAG